MKVVFDCFGKVFSVTSVVNLSRNEFNHRGHRELELQQALHILRRPSQHRAGAALDDWPLDQIRMLDHQRDYFVIAEVFLTQTKFTIDSLVRPQKFAWFDAQLLN